MKIEYTRNSQRGALIERYANDGRAKDYVICAGEDAVVAAIQSMGRPTIIRTGISLNCGEKDVTVSLCLLPSIVDNTGLLLVNPIQTIADGQEIVLKLVNLARSVQTISAGAMLATINIVESNANAQFVETPAQQSPAVRHRNKATRPNKMTTRKD